MIIICLTIGKCVSAIQREGEDEEEEAEKGEEETIKSLENPQPAAMTNNCQANVTSLICCTFSFSASLCARG